MDLVALLELEEPDQASFELPKRELRCGADGSKVQSLKVWGLGFRVFWCRVSGDLGLGSWVVMSGFLSKGTMVIAHTSGLIFPPIPTHEPTSRVWGQGMFRAWRLGFRCVAL